MKPLHSIILTLILSFCFLLPTVHGQCDMDTQPPTAFAVSLSTALLDSDDNQVELWAIDFFVNFSDDCTPEDELRFTFNPSPPEEDIQYEEGFRSSSKLFDCSDVVNSPIMQYIYVWDLAGNMTEVFVNITFVNNYDDSCDECENDTTNPEADFIETINWAFPDDAEFVEVWASDFVLEASDNCTSNGLIKYSFTPVDPNEDPSASVAFFDCYDTENNPIALDVYVWDRNGNYTMGSSEMIIAPPQDGCNSTFINVGGKIISTKNDPIQNATIYLENESGEVLASTTSNENGEYSFLTNTLKKYLRVEYDDESTPLVTTLDLVIIQRYLLGLTQLTDPQILASDINGDGQVKVNDLRMMRKMVLGIIDPDEHIDKGWNFIDQDYDIESNEDKRIIMEGSEGPTIIGYRIGDVN